MTFRITEDEYELVVENCNARNIRSVSGFARLAVQNYLCPHGNGSSPGAADIEHLRASIAALNDRLEKLDRLYRYSREVAASTAAGLPA